MVRPTPFTSSEWAGRWLLALMSFGGVVAGGAVVGVLDWAMVFSSAAMVAVSTCPVAGTPRWIWKFLTAVVSSGVQCPTVPQAFH